MSVNEWRFALGGGLPCINISNISSKNVVLFRRFGILVFCKKNKKTTGIWVKLNDFGHFAPLLAIFGFPAIVSDFSLLGPFWRKLSVVFDPIWHFFLSIVSIVSWLSV